MERHADHQAAANLVLSHVAVERHGYCWWLEASVAANLVGMIPQGGSFHEIAGVAGHTYQCTIGGWKQHLLRHAYCWWLEASADANLVAMIPQGDLFHDIAGVAGHTYQCRGGAACIPLVVGRSSCCQSSGYVDSPGGSSSEDCGSCRSYGILV